MIDSNKPKKAEQVVQFIKHHPVLVIDAGALRGYSKVYAEMLVGQGYAEYRYFAEDGVDITAATVAAQKAEQTAKVAASEAAVAKAAAEAKADADLLAKAKAAQAPAVPVVPAAPVVPAPVAPSK